MKKPLFFGLLIAAVTGLVSTAHAQAIPGCSPSMMALMVSQSDAARVRNRAYQREYLHKNDSTMRMTCLDRAMRVSTRLGYIFSQVIPFGPPIQYSITFDSGTIYTIWGTQRHLATSLRTGPAGQIHVDWRNRFPPTPVPPNSLNVLSVAINAIIGAPISTWRADEDVGNWFEIIGLYRQLQIWMDSLNKIPIAAIPDRIEQIRDIVARIKDREAAIKTNRTTNMRGWLGEAEDLTFENEDIDCTIMDEWWRDGNPVVNIPGPAPDTYFRGTPYLGLTEFLSGGGAGRSPNFITESTSPVNSALMSAAYTEIQRLRTPGLMPDVWPPTFIFPAYDPNLKATNVISQMLTF